MLQMTPLVVRVFSWKAQDDADDAVVLTYSFALSLTIETKKIFVDIPLTFADK